MDAILHYGCVVPCFWSKHFRGSVAIRIGGLDVDLIRLYFRLAHQRKSIDGVLCGDLTRPFSSVPPLREAMPLLRAQHALNLLVVLDFFQNEIRSRLHALCIGVRSFVSHSSVRTRARFCARQLELGLSTVRGSATLALVRSACYRSLHFAMAYPLCDRIRTEHNTVAVAGRVD